MNDVLGLSVLLQTSSQSNAKSISAELTTRLQMDSAGLYPKACRFRNKHTTQKAVLIGRTPLATRTSVLLDHSERDTSAIRQLALLLIR